MPGFKKGKSGNPQGRPAGSQNKIPLSTKQFIHEAIEENRDSFKECLMKLKKDKPGEFCKYFLELVSYDAPKLRSVEVSGDMVSLISEDQSKGIVRDIAKEALFKVFGDQISPELRKKYE